MAKRKHNKKAATARSPAPPSERSVDASLLNATVNSDDDESGSSPTTTAAPTTEFLSARSSFEPRLSDDAANRWFPLLQSADGVTRRLRALGATSADLDAVLQPVSDALRASISAASAAVDVMVAEVQAAKEAEREHVASLNAALYGLSEEVLAEHLPPTDDAMAHQTLREQHATLAAHRANLETIADQRVLWLTRVVDVWAGVQHDIAAARAAMERDAHRLDDVLGRASAIPGGAAAAVVQPSCGFSAASVESAGLTSDQVRRLGRAQDLSMGRIEALTTAATGLLEELWASADQRVEQRRNIVFGLIWSRAKAVAAKVAGSRNSFCADEALSELEHAKLKRAAHLAARWNQIAVNSASATTIARNSTTRSSASSESSQHSGQSAEEAAALPDAIRALIAQRATSNANVIAERLAAVDAEERFALDRVCYYTAAGVAHTGSDCAAYFKAYHGMTADPLYATIPTWANDIPARFRPMLLAATSDAFLTGDAGVAAVEALSLGMRTAVDAEVLVPAAEILGEIELLDALRGDLDALCDVLQAKIEFATTVGASVRRRAALLEENAKYTAISARDRLTSRKPHQAHEMMKEAKVRQQMKEVLPGLERTIADALRVFDAKHPDHQNKVAPLVIDGIVVRDEVLTTLEVPAAVAHSQQQSYSSRALSQGGATPPPRSPVPSRTPLCSTPSNAAVQRTGTKASMARADGTTTLGGATARGTMTARATDASKRPRSMGRPEATPMRAQPLPPPVTPAARTPLPTARRL